MMAVKDMVKGLCYLHGNNVIHHDLKPANVLFDENGKLKLADMGMAEQHLSSSKIDKSWLASEMKNGVACGTPL